MSELKEILSMQKAAQENVYGYDFKNMKNEERIEFITWNVLAATDELHELLAEIGWKPWATSKHINIDSAKSELIDVIHFIANLCIVLEMDEKEVLDLFLNKRKKNDNRFLNDYDGVSNKCAKCKRALDDTGVKCTAEKCSNEVSDSNGK